MRDRFSLYGNASDRFYFFFHLLKYSKIINFQVLLNALRDHRTLFHGDASVAIKIFYLFRFIT